jgi:hypothetical protein
MIALPTKLYYLPTYRASTLNEAPERIIQHRPVFLQEAGKLGRKIEFRAAIEMRPDLYGGRKLAGS